MTEGKEIGVGVIGLGFMGRTHVSAYRAAAADGFANRLVAVSDVNPDFAEGGDAAARGNLDTGDHAERLFDPAKTGFHTEPAELLARQDVDVVSICTHTASHVDLAIQALEAGKHVLVEKPVALTTAEVERLAAVARESDRFCMPAMCIRFWPGWDWLRATIIAESLGPVHSVVLRRLGSHPDWSPEFYHHPAESGGALFDLHVHDADFLRWVLGPPASVTSTGTMDHVTTLYRYPDGPSHVVAEGGWDLSPGFDFEMSFTVACEDATADFRLGREHPLVVHRDGKTEPVLLAPGNGYEGEIRHLLSTIANPVMGPIATVDHAVELTKLLEAEALSLTTGVPVFL